MNCRAENRLYVRADGTVPCNCDIGENVTLFAPDSADPAGFDYVADCYEGAPFRELRASFRAGRPFLECCRNCFFFSPSEPFGAHRRAGDAPAMENLQIESSFHCTIDCAACVPRSVRRDPARSPLGSGPYHLPLAVFEKLVGDLVASGIRVGEFCFCGRGEPLLHPRFGDLVRAARRSHPDSLYTACTNGNVRFSPGVLGLDYLTVSIDGSCQATYERYRKGGNYEAALDFVRAVVAHRRRERGKGSDPDLARHLRKKGRPIVRWKYILFDHNDTDEEIVSAQKQARALGVDQMMFALSHTHNRSKRFTSERQLEELELFRVFDRKPVVYSNLNPESEILQHWAEKGARQQ